MTPITMADKRIEGRVRASQLPNIEKVEIAFTRKGLPLERAFTNAAPIDANKEFFPFGEKPRCGDSFYLASREAFFRSGLVVTLHVDVINAGKAFDKLQVQWEFWSGIKWESIKDVQDGTKAFTDKGDIIFAIPDGMQPAPVNGIEDCWVRARITQGNYGHDLRYIEIKDQNGKVTGYAPESATFAPPLIWPIMIDYEWKKGAEAESILTKNDFTYKPAKPPFKPFKTLHKDIKPLFYLGFAVPPERTTFPHRALSLYVRAADPVFRDGSGAPPSGLYHR